MNDLDRSIIATLAYYGAFGWPLTLVEICGRLIPPQRLGGREAPANAGNILERLERLTAMGMVVSEHGLYAPAETGGGFGDRRIAQEKVWAQKWRKMLRRAWWLQVAPYVRGLYASGSLALGNMSPTSDWDIFIIAEKDRLYTTRVALSLIARCMGRLRTKHDAVASDKFCFNHYITTHGLVRRYRSLYVAHGLSALVPVYDPAEYVGRLWQANQWMGDYIPMPIYAEYVRRSVRPSLILGLIKGFLELMLKGPTGDVLEHVVRRWQRRRIRQVPATRARGGRVIYDDRELEFHPHSFEATALAHYNAALERYGLGQYDEHDSGLQ